MAVAEAKVAAATVAMATVCDNSNEGNEAAVVEGAGGRGQRFAAAAPAATVGAGNGGLSGGSARADNNQLKSGSKNV